MLKQCGKNKKHQHTQSTDQNTKTGHHIQPQLDSNVHTTAIVPMCATFIPQSTRSKHEKGREHWKAVGESGNTNAGASQMKVYLYW